MNNKLIFTRSFCPITNSLDLLGDKWTLLIVRDLVLGKKQYQEFLSSPEGIATNILADRLKRLQEAGIVVRMAYQQNPVRYRYTLTDKGYSLKSVLRILASWGLKNFPGTKTFPSVSIHK
jgi:DNA-binding HxlR family transcriptional regulator